MKRSEAAASRRHGIEEVLPRSGVCPATHLDPSIIEGLGGNVRERFQALERLRYINATDFGAYDPTDLAAELLQIGGREQSSPANDQQFIANGFRLIKLMGGQQDGPVGRKRAKQGLKRPLLHRIKPGSRLVENQD